MKLKDKIIIHKAITTSREYFQDNIGIKCVHYGDIYKNYSGKTVLSSNIINSFINDVSPEKILYCDSIIVPDVTETIRKQSSTSEKPSETRSRQKVRIILLEASE